MAPRFPPYRLVICPEAMLREMGEAVFALKNPNTPVNSFAALEEVVYEAQQPRSQSPLLSTLIKASWGMLTLPNIFIFFFPSFCFSSSLRLREMSPP